MEITGIVKIISEIERGISKTRGNSWQRRTVVLEIEGSHPKQVALELRGNHVENNTALYIGQKVTASFDIESREFNGRWYTTLAAWKFV